MATVEQHYSELLAPVYLWMVGGLDAALTQGESDIDALDLPAPDGGTAVDLGAGFGMHSIPLARRGFTVLALDTSAHLLEALRAAAGPSASVRPIEADLLEFSKHLDHPADLILCMGDTLTHLPSEAAARTLFSEAASSLTGGGSFVATFRDYTRLPTGADRFIPVRSDEHRIMTCFLEERADRVQVHDIVHERQGPTWTMSVSSYPKLRLDPGWVAELLESEHLHVRRDQGPRGMVRVVATRP